MAKLTTKDIEQLIFQQNLEREQEQAIEKWLGEARQFLQAYNIDTLYAVRRAIRALDRYNVDKNQRSKLKRFIEQAKQGKNTQAQNRQIFKYTKQLQRQQKQKREDSTL
jgi:hypothetical protein